VKLAVIHNGKPVPASSVPELSLDELRQAVIRAPHEHRRVAALFGRPRGERIEMVAVLSADEENALRVGRAVIEHDKYRSLTPECPEVHLFERELAEQWGVLPEGHPWLKPVRFVKSGRADHQVFREPSIGVMEFFRVEGEEIHEVAVGPVHAGVIEPGHFRFQCHGEHVFHLEISLGYQHRGVERALLGGPNKRTLHLMETLAGDTTVGHATAYCQLLEGLLEVRVPARAQTLRAIALELERLANHTGNLGALAGDVGFLPTASYCGRLRGDFLNLSALLCGNRFGRSFVVPGGVGFDADEARAATMKDRISAALVDLETAVNLLWNTPSVMARFEETGRVPSDTARALGLVGVAARACGLERDVRRDLPAGIFQFALVPISTYNSGDVFARAYVRWLEIQRSVAFIKDHLAHLPTGPARAALAADARPRANTFGVSLVEGVRGEICHVGETDADGRFHCYKVVDPSFHNWTGLAMALRDQQISDFPLCNKSFDLSYCGHDL
jgi:Ni,Fe-hydrogenase III large subunit